MISMTESFRKKKCCTSEQMLQDYYYSYFNSVSGISKSISAILHTLWKFVYVYYALLVVGVSKTMEYSKNLKDKYITITSMLIQLLNMITIKKELYINKHQYIKSHLLIICLIASQIWYLIRKEHRWSYKNSNQKQYSVVI